MTENQNSKISITSSLPAEAVEEILQRIDDNLSMRRFFHGNLERNENDFQREDNPIQFHSILPPISPDFVRQIVEIRNAQAPYYVVTGGFIVMLVKKVHNLIVKIFGRKQAYFNNHTLNLLENMASYLNALQEYNQQLVASHQQLVASHQQLVASHQQLAASHQQLARDLDGLNAWVNLLSRKVEMLSLNVRETMGAQSYKTTEWPEPYIVDSEKYAQRMSDMKGMVKINLGCGEKPLPNYINIDFREVPDVDVVADVHRLPFDPQTVFEISSAHLVEHFREHHLRMALLPYWKSLLAPGGQLRIVCPNWAAMFEQMNSGRMSLDMFKKITFGAQDYDGDDHFAMYTPETLERLLLAVGFNRVERVVLDRLNGDCPEMELLAKL